MKISVSSYSFNALFKTGELNQFDCIAAAKEIGFQGIEFVGILPHDGSSREEYAHKLATEAKNQGLDVTCYTFSADLLAGSDGDTKAEVKRIKDEIKFAEILGAPRIRHDVSSGVPASMPHHVSYDDVLPILAEACRDISEYAAGMGIQTLVENHGWFFQDSDRVEKLVSAVAHPNFKLLVDMGNFLCVDEDSTKAVGRLAKYAGYVHAKDFHKKTSMEPSAGEGYRVPTRGGNFLRGAIIGHGVVPVKQCLHILHSAGYGGYVAIEFEGMENPLLGVRVGFQNLHRYIAEVCEN